VEAAIIEVRRNDLSEIGVPVPGGALPAHVALPSISPPGGRSPVVLLLPPIFGVTQAINEFARRIADHGFAVVTPDMFWRTHPGPLGYEGADREAAQQRYTAFDVSQGMADLRALVNWAKVWPIGTGAVGIVGLCFGGRYAFLAAAELPIDVGVSFHGTFIGQHLNQCARVACPLSVHFGEEVAQAPMEEVRRIEAASSGNPNIEVYRYPKAKHGFMQHDRPSFLPPAADLAFARGLGALVSMIAPAERAFGRR
jgi:carboxymethylenebutenolidase